MARFNEILAGRYNRYLQKLFQLKGGPPSAQLASEVMPVFPFFTGVEHRYLEGWNRYWVSTGAQAGVAAQFGKARLKNITSKNVIVVIEKISLQGIAAANSFVFSVQRADATANLANIFNGVPLDFRSAAGGTGNSSATFSGEVSAVVDLPAVTYVLPAIAVELISFEEQEITLLPGDTLQVRDGSANDTFTCSMIWRERSLEESELK